MKKKAFFVMMALFIVCVLSVYSQAPNVLPPVGGRRGSVTLINNSSYNIQFKYRPWVTGSGWVELKTAVVPRGSSRTINDIYIQSDGKFVWSYSPGIGVICDSSQNGKLTFYDGY